MTAVRDYALSQPSASDKSATIGFCWGGGASFAYATHQPKLNAAVVYYGTPPQKEDMAKIACPILGCYGGNDARVSATVDPTKIAMSDLKKDYNPHVYDGGRPRIPPPAIRPERREPQSNRAGVADDDRVFEEKSKMRMPQKRHREHRARNEV